MGINSLSDDADYEDGGAEKTREDTREGSEKKGDSGKAMAGIKRTRKDEKKAQKDNDFLYEVIIDIIRNSEFDIIIPLIIDLLKIGVPSNLILGGISLIFNEATYIIRTNYRPGVTKMILDKQKAQKFNEIIEYSKTQKMINFDENNLDVSIKNRINAWIDDILNVISFDPSTIITEKFFIILDNPEQKELVVNYFAGVLSFFLYSQNIVISKEKAFLYSEFILDEVEKKLKLIELEEI